MASHLPVSDHSLKHRILELLQPFRENLGNPSTTEGKKLLLLAQNIASVVASKQSKYPVKAEASDVYIMSRNFNSIATSGPPYLRVFVTLDNQSITVVKVKTKDRKSAIGALVTEVDWAIESFFEDV